VIETQEVVAAELLPFQEWFLIALLPVPNVSLQDDVLLAKTMSIDGESLLQFPPPREFS